MGQYYTPVLKAKSGKVMRFNSFDFDNGMKIMEHSWIGNNFVNAVMYKIKNEACRIAWVGDYAGDGENDEKYKNDLFDWFVKETDVKEYCKSRKMKFDIDNVHGYLVNVTKKQYVDLKDYFEKSKKIENGDVWCVHPLPLLTSIGNGAGGGDYWGVNKEVVGMWATDEVQFVEELPEGMEKLEVAFWED